MQQWSFLGRHKPKLEADKARGARDQCNKQIVAPKFCIFLCIYSCVCFKTQNCQKQTYLVETYTHPIAAEMSPALNVLIYVFFFFFVAVQRKASI